MLKQLISFIFIGFSTLAIAQFSEQVKVDSVFLDWTKPDIPGCALGIFKDGEILYSKGYGFANLEYDIPNSPTSVFRIGSTSKQFTAACIILLQQENKLSFNDNLKSYFPEFPKYAENITIQHLLNHTSGIRDYLQLAYLKGLEDNDYYEDEDIMQWLINQSDLNFEPGEEYVYSNSGYWLLGQIVEKASGKNMAEYAEEKIFEPLKMTDTHFHTDHSQIVKNRASGYMPDRDGGYSISMTTLPMIGDGGIFTTINDIKKWDDAFYKSSVLNGEFWQKMTEKGKLNNGDEIDYASGLDVSKYKGLNTVSHGGAFVGFRAELLRFPDQKLTIAIFANRADARPTSKAFQIADILLKDQFIIEDDEIGNENPIDVTPEEEIPLEQLVGSYEIQMGAIATFSVENDSLVLTQEWNESKFILERAQGNTFNKKINKQQDFTFSKLEDGSPQRLTFQQGSMVIVAPRKYPYDASALNLSDYVGIYYSKELNVEYKIAVENKTLKIGIVGGKFTLEGKFEGQDKLITDFGLLRFKREDGNIAGFELDSGRVKNLKFVRK